MVALSQLSYCPMRGLMQGPQLNTPSTACQRTETVLRSMMKRPHASTLAWLTSLISLWSWTCGSPDVGSFDPAPPAIIIKSVRGGNSFFTILEKMAEELPRHAPYICLDRQCIFFVTQGRYGGNSSLLGMNWDDTGSCTPVGDIYYDGAISIPLYEYEKTRTMLEQNSAAFFEALQIILNADMSRLEPVCFDAIARSGLQDRIDVAEPYMVVFSHDETSRAERLRRQGIRFEQVGDWLMELYTFRQQPRL